MIPLRQLPALLAPLALLAACGDGDAGAEDGATVVVSTSILGDVVAELVGDQAEVITIVPRGADPHSFQPSARDVDRIRRADALVVNGAGFEEALADVVESAEADGVPTHEAISAVSTLAGGEDHAHGDEDEHEEDEHDGDDPHFFTDPGRMAEAVDGITSFLAEQLPGVDAEALDSSAAGYVAELEALDADVERELSGIRPEDRVLVTSHEVFGYFAERYDFEVVGTVIPGTSSADAASAGGLAELAETVEQEGVGAVFVDASASAGLARAVAAEVGDVEVVELYTESLGEEGSAGDTYLGMVRANARRIADALG